MADSATRYASLPRSRALLILICLILFIGWCLAVAPGRGLIPKPSDAKESDMAIYANVVQRMHAGEGYYEALGSELRSHKRPTSSVLNWRTPLHLSLLALFPNLIVARVLLGIAALAALAIGFILVARGGNGALAAIQTLLMFGIFVPCFAQPGIFFAELWAAALIMISIGAYGFGWRRTGVGVGLLAVFFRELALPYVLVSGLLAWKKSRRREVLVLTAGLGAYAVYLLVHVLMVTSRITPADIPNPAGWVQFGGVSFLLRTSSVGWLMILPPWIAAIYLPGAFLGLGGWTDPVARRILLTVAIYTAAFAVVGHSTNFYWGALYAPLLTFGAVWSAPALADLLRAVLPGRSSEPSTEA